MGQLVLFILPVLLVLSNIFYPNIALFFQGMLNSPQIGIDFVFYFQTTVLVIMLIIYPFYPAIFSTERYFKKIGNYGGVIEYKMLEVERKRREEKARQWKALESKVKKMYGKF